MNVSWWHPGPLCAPPKVFRWISHRSLSYAQRHGSAVPQGWRLRCAPGTAQIFSEFVAAFGLLSVIWVASGSAPGVAAAFLSHLCRHSSCRRSGFRFGGICRCLQLDSALSLARTIAPSQRTGRDGRPPEAGGTCEGNMRFTYSLSTAVMPESVPLSVPGGRDGWRIDWLR